MNGRIFIFLFLFPLFTFAQSIQTLRIAMVEEPNTLNPAFRGSTAEGIINALTVRSLAHFNARSELVPHLAKTLPVFVGKELQFEIKESAKWDDGVPVTCEDFQTGFSAASKFGSYSDEAAMEKVIVDPSEPRKCKILFRYPKPVYTLYITQPLPTRLEKKIIDSSKDEVEYLKRTNYSQNPTLKGLSNGPYKMSVYKPGYYFEFVRNPLFYGKQAPFEKVQIRFFKNTQSMISAYQTGQVDAILNGLTSDHFDEIKSVLGKTKGKLVSNSSTRLIHLEFNLGKQPMQDLRLRKALSRAIDPVELKKIIEEDGDLTGSVIHPLDPNYQFGFEKPIFQNNRREALKLLKEAGYTPDGAGQLKNKAGEFLEMDLALNTEDRDRERVAVYLQNKWSSLGIKVNIKKSLKRILMGEILKKGRYDVAIFGWSIPKLQVNQSFFGADRIPTEEKKWVGNNYARWNNAKATQALKEADKLLEIEKIKKPMNVFLTELRQDLPWLPLYFQKRWALVPQSFEGFEVFPDWEDGVYEIEHWLD